MATFNLWQWVLVAIVVFAIVLPACLATALIWFGPRHDAPRSARPTYARHQPLQPGVVAADRHHRRRQLGAAIDAAGLLRPLRQAGRIDATPSARNIIL